VCRVYERLDTVPACWRAAHTPSQESDGISPTAIRELMLRELKHEHIIHLDSVHLNRQARQLPLPLMAQPARCMLLCACTYQEDTTCQDLLNLQDPCLSLAFDYAEHDLYAMIAYHRERLRSAPIPAYTLKSVMWQLLNGLSYLEQVLVALACSMPCNQIWTKTQQADAEGRCCARCVLLETCGLCWLQNWVIHRDLKPSNILVMGDGPEQVPDIQSAAWPQGHKVPLHSVADRTGTDDSCC
jgi:cyclin-dependent kinase 8/11